VTGGTGFVGASVCQALRASGHRVTVVTRDPAHGPAGSVGWDAVAAAVADADVLVNLAGESVASGRWTAERKRNIFESRVTATRTLVDATKAATARPSVLVNASAIGIYGPHGDETLEESAPPGSGFLARVCEAWEGEALRAEELGLRVVRLRLGIVLASDGGALARMLPPFRAFVGGPIGDGKQWMSWIHRDDVTGLIQDALRDPTYQGAVNATAPHPVTNREFVRTLGRVMARPAIMPVPAFVLRLALGAELASMLLTGQRVLPSVANTRGYRWRYPDLTTALRASVH
jgi:uncharacterized protein (TIGR01777 family)